MQGASEQIAEADGAALVEKLQVQVTGRVCGRGWAACLGFGMRLGEGASLARCCMDSSWQ
jgi:hypothetical protein